MSKHDLNSADYGRIEAALREFLKDTPANANPVGVRAVKRTLDKIERINQTGEYTPQYNGLTIRESRRRDEQAARKAGR